MGVGESPNISILEISKRPLISSIREILHTVTTVAMTFSGSIGLLLFYDYLPWIPVTWVVFMVLALIVAIPAAVYFTLTVCLFFTERHKKRLLEEYTSLTQRDPSAKLPGDSGRKLLDCLNEEWTCAAWVALTKPSAQINKTLMADCFTNLQKCKFAYELETFCGFLKKDLTEEQRQKVEEIQENARKKFDDEMCALESNSYTTRMRYCIMTDFFIILESDMMNAAIDAGLTDYKLPKHELKISHLALSGGGARGYAYGKMLEKLKDSFTPNCRFSGTSAGAIGALAAALNLDDFAGLTIDMQKRYNNSARDNQQWQAAYAWLRLRFSSWPSYYDLTGVLALFDQRAQEKVSIFLKGISEETIEKIFTQDPGARDRIHVLREPYDPLTSREGKMLTFKDIEFLQKLPGGEQFHDFATAIWDKTDQKVVFAKKETQPNMPIVLAVYASMSIPLAFKFLSMEMDGSDGKTHQLCDGGFSTNCPLEAYPDSKSSDGESIGIIFDRNGLGGETVREKATALLKPARVMARLLGIAPSIEKADEEEKMRLWQNRERILVCPHGDLSTLSFSFSDAERKAIDHQVDLRAEAWKICKTYGKHWPESIWPKTPL
ncbi:MAG: patatin-like phospholipase family protein [Puniceicoccales bacterium]|jgi:predicted acylesterase/phospholipase RssA|nr:patatin-like phospholipase family protein [Puniceicoccales bacterium]